MVFFSDKIHLSILVENVYIRKKKLCEKFYLHS